MLHRNVLLALLAVGVQYLLTQYRLEHFSHIPARLKALLWGDALRARLVEGALGARAPEPAQPDAVRGASHAAQPMGVDGVSGGPGAGGQCSSRIGASSVRTTLGVRVGVRTVHRGGGEAGHTWSYQVRFENVCESNGHVTLTTIYAATWLGEGGPPAREAAERLMRFTHLMYHIYHMLTTGPMDEAKWELLHFRGLVTKIISNGCQGILFSVLWRLGQDYLNKQK